MMNRQEVKDMIRQDIGRWKHELSKSEDQGFDVLASKLREWIKEGEKLMSDLG